MGRRSRKKLTFPTFLDFADFFTSGGRFSSSKYLEIVKRDFVVFLRNIFSKKLTILRLHFYSKVYRGKTPPGGDKTMKITKNLKMTFCDFSDPRCDLSTQLPKNQRPRGVKSRENLKVDFFAFSSLFAPRTVPVAGATGGINDIVEKG